MCVRCLKEGFVDDFPWPVQEEEGEGGESVDTPASGLWSACCSAVQSLSLCLPLPAGGMRIRYLLPAYLPLVCGGRQQWAAGAAFNALLFASLTLSQRRLRLDGLLQGKAGKKKKKSSVVLCRVIPQAAHSAM
jgi:hypothetical protein